MEVVKTIGIRLDILSEQEIELKQLFNSFNVGINWSLREIENHYQKFILEFKPLPEKKRGICISCNIEKELWYIRNGKEYCRGCASRVYSEYTVRKEIYGVGERTVENDLKDVIEIPNKTHYTMLFAQAYAMWKSFNSWRDKRIYQANILERELESSPIYKIVIEIEQLTRQIKDTNKNLTWFHANAQAFKKIYGQYPNIDRKEINYTYKNLRVLRRLSKPLRLPQPKDCRTIMVSNGFVKWSNEQLYLTLWTKKPQLMNYFGKEYLKQFIPKMEDKSSYCNITKKNNDYYLMYPLKIKIKQPVNIKECDTFVVIFSPEKIGIFGYDQDICLNSVKWLGTGQLKDAKQKFKEKRAEISMRRSDNEPMRKIHRRIEKIKTRGNLEHRFVSTFNHQLTHKIVEIVAGMSENPKIIIWDIGNGITQNFGRQLNYLKNLWPVVQQQDYLRHKAMQIGIPIIEIQYNKCNDLICSSCGAKQSNGQKSAKVITQLIKGIKQFKCEKCGYEVNMLINQANNIVNI